jgi:hypothetical protein
MLSVLFFMADVPPKRRLFVCPIARWGQSGRAPPSRGSDPLQNHQPAYVVGEVLQTDLGARPHDADGTHDPATRRVFLRAEDVLDTGADLALAAVSFLLRFGQRMVA